MIFEETIAYLRARGPSIGALAKQKDTLAVWVVYAYSNWYQCKFDPKAQALLMRVADEYCRRECTVTELTELEKRYGTSHPDKTV